MLFRNVQASDFPLTGQPHKVRVITHQNQEISACFEAD
jgi:hypothetical protein